MAHPAILVAELLKASDYLGQAYYCPPTAASFAYGRWASTPVETVRLRPGFDDVHARALDWMDLGQSLFKESRPMSRDERASVAEFFWSQFD
jgi:hypothetical protein